MKHGLITAVVIPARGGSKGIPNKNLRTVGGLPLIARAVRAASGAKLVDAVLVSTDDRRIADIAYAWGADIIERPPELSSDFVSSEAAILHALDEFEKRPGSPPIGVCVLVQCTSPFVSSNDIDEVISSVLSGRADCCFTATVSKAFLWSDDPMGATALNHDARLRQRRQDRTGEVMETGAAYAMRSDGLRSEGSRFFGRVRPHLMPAVRSLEIDDESDLLFAEALLSVTGKDLAGPTQFPRSIGLVAFDFDGVMTDDRAIVLQDGTEGVLVHRGDGLGIENLRQAGVPMLVLSKERNLVVAARCAKLQIPVLQGVNDKWDILSKQLEHDNIDPSSVVYVGNDINDLGCFARVGFSVAVADADPKVLVAADMILSKSGGHGAVREISDLLLSAIEIEVGD